ncbi:LuxR C-terminal-related transcriptional regulator [Streptomyces hirsutus]|uniref:LuxR C-terminal-related transcriptional regulator n=1 Tax=Streptomyces hirsutus TaxID=35620 RepID=UPI0036A4EEE9
MEINLFVISNNPVALAGLEAIFDQDDEVTVIGRAVDGSDGIRCLEHTESEPHVIIIGEPSSKRTVSEDVHRITSRYRNEKSRPKVIVVSQNDDDDAIFAALRGGVNGYLAHIGSSEELLYALQIVAKGGAAFSPTIAVRLSQYFTAMQLLREPTEFSDLTGRELEILTLLADGMGNQQIARRLYLAEKTVRNYVSRIFAKLEVHDRTTAAVLARDAGLGGPGGLAGPGGPDGPGAPAEVLVPQSG